MMDWAFTLTPTDADLHRFAEATGDWNPIHFHDDAAQQAGLPGRCAHGLWLAGQVAEQVQARGFRVRLVTARFERPLLVGGCATVTIWTAAPGHLRWRAVDEQGERLARGEFRLWPQAEGQIQVGPGPG